MSNPNLSPMLSPQNRPQKAPEPSAALLALQQQGFELSNKTDRSRTTTITEQSDAFLRVSPLSFTSTSSNLDKPLPLEPLDTRWRRPSSAKSAQSADTTVSGILNLYINASETSLKSEYEEVTPYPDTDSEDDIDKFGRLQCKVHQPKAYRDTIAPLLEHQFSTDKLVVPPVPSPMSFVSLPHLHHPNANVSVPSLHLTPDPSPDPEKQLMQNVSLSQTSIQITPEMTPPMHPQRVPTFQEYSTSLRERKVALEVPDVRDADSWYDQPLSPISPEELDRRKTYTNRYFAVSPEEAVEYQRQLTYDALIPPLSTAKNTLSAAAPDMSSETNLPVPTVAELREVSTDSMMPVPLDLDRVRSHRKVSEGSAPVHKTQVQVDCEADIPKSQHASLVTADPIEGPMRSYLTPPPPERSLSVSPKLTPQEIDEIYRPGSAFSDDSTDGKGDALTSHLKAAFKFKKQKKKHRNRQSKEHASRGSNKTQDNDDLQSYTYSYWKTHAMPSETRLNPTPQPATRQDSVSSDAPATGGASYFDLRHNSIGSGPGPSVNSSPQPPDALNARNGPGTPSPRPTLRRYAAQAAIPLTDYQKYGSGIWDYKLMKQQVKEEAREAKAAAKRAKKEAKAAAKSGVKQDNIAESSRGHYDINNVDLAKQNPQMHEYFHTRPSSSRAYSHMHTTSIGTSSSRPSSDASSVASYRRSYNNDLFEASGGKKMGGIMSRLTMSSEERRKQKVKESIQILGGGKVGTATKVAGAHERRSDGGTSTGLVKL